jgi:hypothetical protein
VKQSARACGDAAGEQGTLGNEPRRLRRRTKQRPKHPVNSAKLCAGSNTCRLKLLNGRRFLNVTINKCTDIVQGFEVRTDSDTRERNEKEGLNMAKAAMKSKAKKKPMKKAVAKKRAAKRRR